ncbi:kinase-like domain-containing protein [Mycena rebaudengoi]|nr:kinase-like domain-containing protein [Mycena rebaudengoi]
MPPRLVMPIFGAPLDQSLGQISYGASGVVWKAADVRSGRLIALKVFNASRRDLGDGDRVSEIFELLFSRPHPCHKLFVNLLGRTVYDGNDCLLYELGGMSLDRLLKVPELAPLLYRHVREIACQVARAIEFMHSLNVVHSDIKPANVVLVDDGRLIVQQLQASGAFEILRSAAIKVIDLDDAVRMSYVRRHNAGTNAYRAPEICAGRSWSKPIDAFSFGCLVAELALGRPVFQVSGSSAERLASMERVIGPFDSEFVKDMDDADLLFYTVGAQVKVRFDAHTYGTDAAKRVSNAVPFLNGVRGRHAHDFCAKLLRLNPLARLTISGALAHAYLATYVVPSDR